MVNIAPVIIFTWTSQARNTIMFSFSFSWWYQTDFLYIGIQRAFFSRESPHFEQKLLQLECYRCCPQRSLQQLNIQMKPNRIPSNHEILTRVESYARLLLYFHFSPIMIRWTDGRCSENVNLKMSQRVPWWNLDTKRTRIHNSSSRFVILLSLNAGR